MQAAPYFAEIAQAPEGGAAYWLVTDDDVRIRMVAWPENPVYERAKGTVLIFPGRTEYAEKYGPTAAAMAQRGYASAAVDWRGQGLADRLLDDARKGHVATMDDYQIDVAAMMQAANDLNLPKPFFLLAHSMGGCIGLRSLHNGLKVDATVFSAPMWGIHIAPVLRPFVQAIGAVFTRIGLGNCFAPSTSPLAYVLEASFEDNKLTTDPGMYKFMQDQLRAQPEFELGGPTVTWVYESLRETRQLCRMGPPKVPTLTFLGTNERIVDMKAVIDTVASWPNGALDMVDGAEHEVLMDTPQVQARIFDACDRFFQDNS